MDRERAWWTTVHGVAVGHNRRDLTCSTEISLLGILLLCSVTQLCSALFDPMDCSTPGFPVLHRLPKLAQIHAH